jgi:phosphate transport system ATP-binding protein
MPHISVKSLSVNLGSHAALKDVSVDFPDGQITAIIGPSGCGKTTLLKSVNRLIDLQEGVRVTGRVLLDGEDVYDPETDLLDLRKKVGFLSQQPFPLPMSVYDNVAFGPRIHGIRGEDLLGQLGRIPNGHAAPAGEAAEPAAAAKGRRASEMDVLVETYLRYAGLWDEVKDRLGAPAARLSVGQQQRLALARALAVEPEAILADEPTSALDPVSARLVEQQFLRLKQRYTLVVVTHILRQARRLADYVVFLYLGELVEHGPAEQLFKSPRDPRTAAYIAGEFS